LTAAGNRISGKSFDQNTLTFVNIPFEYRGDTAITLTQPVLKNSWIDAGRLVIKLSKKDLKLTELGFQSLAMDILRRVAVTYYDLLAARDQVKVQLKAQELAQQLLAENKKKVEVGTMAPLDEKQAESQAAKAKADVTTAIFNAQLAENLLKSLITHDFGDIQSTTIEPSDKLIAVYQSFSLPESWRSGLERRPDYLQAKETVERQNIVLQYRRNQLFPSLDLSATYGRNAFGSHSEEWTDSMKDNRFAKYGGAVVFTFPLTFRNDRDAFKKAKIDKEVLVLSLKRRQDLVMKDIDDALKGVQASYATTVSTHEARIYAEAALDAEQKKLENGKSTSFNVLQFQKDLTSAASSEIKALADYNKSLHQLYFNEGTTLERNKVTLDVK
jgi:outer membrane protein TolC